MSLPGVYRHRHNESEGSGAHTNPAFEEAHQPNDGVAAIREPSVENGGTTTETANHEEETLQERIWKEIDSVTIPVWEAIKERKKLLLTILAVILTLLYCAGLIYACIRCLSDATVMLVLTGLVVLALIYRILQDRFGETVDEKMIQPLGDLINKLGSRFTWFVVVVLLILAVMVVIFLCRNNPRQLSSAAGLIVYIFAIYVTSKNPRKVKWRPVLWGLALQFMLGLIILRTQVGFDVFHWLGVIVESFLEFSDAGAIFLFGETYTDHFFAFKILPVVIYFSCIISILYHWGVVQVIIKKLAWLMQRTMKTSASESLNAAGNIFLSMTEAPLLIRPLIEDMTKSELHAVLTGGFATIAGSVLGAYIAFGISASHLTSASVMSAPAALAIAKLSYPETEKSKHVTVEDIDLSARDCRNTLEAAAHGASTAVFLVLTIAANLIAFIAILALLNGILGYIGGLLGWEFLSFEWICSYLFIPLALLMGVEPKDCRLVAKLIGYKTFLNEFVAYDELSILIKNRQDQSEGGEYMSIRSEIIATYALCGFSNISAIAIQLGALTQMAPSRAKDLASVAVRALIAGSVACFMTACIAGLLYDESKYDAFDVPEYTSNRTEC